MMVMTVMMMIMVMMMMMMMMAMTSNDWSVRRQCRPGRAHGMVERPPAKRAETVK